MKILPWFKEPQFYLVACIHMAASLFVNISQAYIAFFVHYTINLSEEMIAVTPLVMYIAGIVVSLVLKFLPAKFGLKMPFGLSCVIGLGILILDMYDK